MRARKDGAKRDDPGRVAQNSEGLIPFMGMLGGQLPGAQFMITGMLGPHSKKPGRDRTGAILTTLFESPVPCSPVGSAVY